MSEITNKTQAFPFPKGSLEYKAWLEEMSAFVAFARELGRINGHDFLERARAIFFGVPPTVQGYQLARAALLEYAVDWRMTRDEGMRFSVKEILGRDLQTPEDVNDAQMILTAQTYEELRVIKGGKLH